MKTVQVYLESSQFHGFAGKQYSMWINVQGVRQPEIQYVADGARQFVYGPTTNMDVLTGQDLVIGLYFKSGLIESSKELGVWGWPLPYSSLPSTIGGNVTLQAAEINFEGQFPNKYQGIYGGAWVKIVTVGMSLLDEEISALTSIDEKSSKQFSR